MIDIKVKSKHFLAKEQTFYLARYMGAGDGLNDEK
jgi:hypothetical protein